MKFVSIFKCDSQDMAAPPDAKQMAAMGELIDEMRAARVLLDTGGVMSTSTSMRVRREGARVTVTDGPFTESKEVVGGFAVIDVASKDDALAWTRRFLGCAGNGVTELFEVSTVP